MAIFFLRNRNNKTIVDCEVYPVSSKPEYKNQDGYVELHSIVVIDIYTDLLLENLEHAETLKTIFREIQELRGWLWESYLPNKDNKADRYVDVLRELRKMFANYATQINDLCGAGVFVVED